MHTQGEVKVEPWSKETIALICEKNGLNNSWIIAEFQGPEMEDNAAHTKALWNAANGMTTEQAVQAIELGKAIIVARDANPDNFIMTTNEAVRYLKHGREMHKLLEKMVVYHNSGDLCFVEFDIAKRLLKTMEGE